MKAREEAQSLWPETPAQPRIRPLRYREEPTMGQRIYVGGIEGKWRFQGWMHCGRERYALLASDGTQELFVCVEERVRVEG